MVEDLKNDYLTPNSQNLFQPDDIIRHLDKAMRSKIIPLINSAREDYWIENFDQPVTGAASYTIPQRAAGAILVNVQFLDSANNPIELERLTTKKIASTFPFGYQLPLYSFGYYLQDDQVVLYPQQAVNATGYTLRMIFMRRPNNLTSVTNCGQITNVASNVVTLDNLPSDWTTATTFDIIENFPQFKSISDGATISAIDTLTSSVELNDVPDDIEEGMYFCPTLTTCIPQIPYEAYDLLVAAGAARIARSLGDSQGTELALKNYEELSKDFIKLIEPRVQQASKKLVNRNQQWSWGVRGTPFIR